MKPKYLMRACEDLYNGFNPVIQTLDSYISDSLGDCSSPAADPANKFISQVLCSCDRYKPGLHAFLKHFFCDNAPRVARRDYTMYLINALPRSLPPRGGRPSRRSRAETRAQERRRRMATFLRYLFDATPGSPVQATVKQEWCKHYDVNLRRGDSPRHDRGPRARDGSPRE